jgi:hypothetical protein
MRQTGAQPSFDCAATLWVGFVQDASTPYACYLVAPMA